MSAFSSERLGTTQRARLVAVMVMMPVRPEMIRTTHFAGPESRQAYPHASIDGTSERTDTRNASFESLRRLTLLRRSATFVLYLVEVRIPLVVGRAFPISFGRPAKGVVLDPPKSARQLNAVRGWGPGLRPVHCHP
jgi:hypothetical protein